MNHFRRNSPLGIFFILGLYTLLCVKSCSSDVVAANAVAAGQADFEDRAYAQVLQTHVTLGRVDYAALRAHPDELNHYLDQLRQLAPERYDAWSAQQKIAFWINAYNACTLSTVIEHYPVKSIRDIPKVWLDRRWGIMGKTYSLDAMEHNILRRQFDEPRIHVALVCAAISCPPLRDEPYRAAQLEAQLEDQLRKVAQGKTWFRVDQRKNIAFLSRLFFWYGKDFQGKYKSSIDFKNVHPYEAAVLTAFYPFLSDLDQRFIGHGHIKVQYLDYDWGLNGH